MLTGNREFNGIYEKYKNLVLKVAYIYSGNNYHVAEDIAQDTFLKLYMGFDELKNGNISAWLFTTAKNSALNHKKKYKREMITDDDEILKKDVKSGKSAEEGYLEHDLGIKRAELNRRILDGLIEKNPRWHEAIILVYYMEVPQAKAAEMLGIKVNVLHSMLHRAKNWIKKNYNAEYEEMKTGD